MIKTAVPKLEAEYNMSKIVNHSASKGALREFLLKEIIRPFLPKDMVYVTGNALTRMMG